MKKNNTIKLVIAILIVVAIIIVISKITGNKDVDTRKLTQLYNELNTNQTYLFEMEQSNNNKTIMAKKGDKAIIDQYSKDGHTTTIVKDNNTYLVLHDREEYYVYENNNIEQSILTDGLKEITNKEFTTGKEKIDGKKYSYEEYSGSTMFMSATTLDMNEEDIKTRFYFDNDDNLVYIRTIKGVNQELLKIKIEKEVDDSIFEIPSNYAEN